MATSYDFLLQDFGNWTPGIPDQQESNPYDVPEQGWDLPTGPPTDNVTDPATTPDNIDFWGGDGGVASQNWASAMLPLYQLLSNNDQFRTEFQEAQNRFWNQNEWSQGRDLFNMDLAGRQQSAQEQQALWAQQNWGLQFDEQQINDQVAREVAQGNLSLAQATQAAQQAQWEQSFAAQNVNDEHARTIADQQLAMAQERMGRELTLAEQQQVWNQSYQMQRLEQEAENARYATFGRGQAPSRWAASWG